jgi:hypothetical protein
MKAHTNFFASTIAVALMFILLPGNATASALRANEGIEDTISLRISRQPRGARSGTEIITQPVVRIYDAKNRLVRSATSAITATSSSGTLQGSTTILAIGGIATFTDLALFGTQGQGFTLNFSLATGESVRSSPFSLLPSKNAAALKIDPLPSQVISGQKLAIPISGYAIDAAGNKLNNIRSNITLNISGGNLFGTSERILSPSKNGVFAFPFLTIVGTGTITITTTAANGLTGSATVESKPGCPEVKMCNVGDIGPGGGIVYYSKSTPFTSPGSPCSTKCQYLEIAPKNWEGLNKCPQSSPTIISKCSLLPTNISAPLTSTSIGSGHSNTEAIVSALASSVVTNAAVRARAYRGGNLTDWYLPSRDELMIISNYSSQLNRQERQTSLYISSCRTWSSSLGLIGSKTRGWAVSATLATPKSSKRSTAELNCVRPVRAF